MLVAAETSGADDKWKYHSSLAGSALSWLRSARRPPLASESDREELPQFSCSSLSRVSLLLRPLPCLFVCFASPARRLGVDSVQQLHSKLILSALERLH